MESQNKLIIADLLTGVRLTSMDALNRYGCARLASRINQIKNMGFDVKKETIVLPNKKHVARYFIEPEVKPKVLVDLIGGQLAFL